MTTYILAGGRDRRYSEYGRQLARVIGNEIKNPVILSCMFAKSTEEAEAAKSEWQEWFSEYFGIESGVIVADRTAFFGQIDKADVIYLHGGRTDLLIDALSDFERVERAFEGKIVVGSSAGANYLSSYCYSPSRDIILKGSGLLDTAVMVHYGQLDIEGTKRTPGEWAELEASFRMQSGATDVLRLPEGTFAVISKP